MSECILWEGQTLNGYGIRYLTGRTNFVHRQAWEDINGPVPAGMDIAHSCHVRNCYNEEHLRPRTRSENLRERPMPPTCPKGHERCPANARKSKATYECAICHRIRNRRYKEAA